MRIAFAAVMSFGLATTVLAHGGVKDETVMARMGLMTDIKQAIGVLGDMAQDKRAFDAGQASAARAALVGHAGKIPAAFKVPATDPKSESRPDIWLEWSGFVAKATAMEQAAKALDVQSLDHLRAGMGALGDTCSGCHKPYRIKK